MRSLKKKKSDLGNGSHCVSGPSSNPDGAPKTNPDADAENQESQVTQKMMTWMKMI